VTLEQVLLGVACHAERLGVVDVYAMVASVFYISIRIAPIEVEDDHVQFVVIAEIRGTFA